MGNVNMMEKKRRTFPFKLGEKCHKSGKDTYKEIEKIMRKNYSPKER